MSSTTSKSEKTIVSGGSTAKIKDIGWTLIDDDAVSIKSDNDDEMTSSTNSLEILDLGCEDSPSDHNVCSINIENDYYAPARPLEELNQHEK